MKNPAGVIYAGCEAGKKLPFRSKFIEVVVTNPINHIAQIFKKAGSGDGTHTVVIDTLTYLMDMYESQYVMGAADGMKAWANYAQYLKNLMQEHIAKTPCNVIVLAHTLETYNESSMSYDTKVPIKGASKNTGVESWFSCVISAKKMSLTDLEPYDNPLLIITEDDRLLGFKHVFQTRLTKGTIGERIRSPLGMWSVKETFIDNNAQMVLDRLVEFYGTP